MDIGNLKETYPKLLSYLQERGYQKSTINYYRHEILRIIENAEKKQWTSYKDIYQEYVDDGCSHYWLKGRRALLGTLERFDLYGLFPDGHHHYPFFIKKAYDHLTAEYQLYVDYYLEKAAYNGQSGTVSPKTASAAATFFLDLQEKGCSSLEDATEEIIMSIFYSEAEEIVIKSHDYRQRIEAVLKVCMDLQPAVCRQIMGYIPIIHAYRKNVPILTESEIKKIKIVLKDPENGLLLRDKAIGMLALYTGLRSGDIMQLEFSSIKWIEEKISLYQQKTQVPIEIPLSALVGNSIYTYILEERPNIDDPHIFLTTDVPYRPMRTIHQVSRHIFREAGIRQELGSRKGLHLFRHHLATKLLENEIPQPVISRALGQTSPYSLNTYLHTDFSHLKECSLSVEGFPVREEVFQV